VGIILLIGKAIITIIAYLLLILLVLILVVLFVPITYSAKASRYEEICAEGKAGWLFNFFMLKIIYKEKEEYFFKIAGIKVFSTQNTEIDKENSFKNDDIEFKENKKDAFIELKQEKSDANYSENVNKDKKEKKKKQKKPIKKEQPKEEKYKDKIKFKNKAKKKSKNKEKDNPTIKDRIKEIKEFFDRDEYKGVIKFVLFHIKKTVLSFLPKKFKARLIFGTEDPALTGCILGGASMLYAFTKDKLIITPDFEETKLQGEVDFKGRIYIAVIVYHGLRVILDKRVRKIIKEYK